MPLNYNTWPHYCRDNKKSQSHTIDVENEINASVFVNTNVKALYAVDIGITTRLDMQWKLRKFFTNCISPTTD